MLYRVWQLIILGLGVVVFLGCMPEAERQAIVITATPDTLATSVNHQAPTLVPLNIVNANSPTATPPATEVAQACFLVEDVNTRPQYTVNMTVDWAAHRLEAEQQVIYTNQTGVALDALVFQVEPNRQQGFFNLTSATLDDGTPLTEITTEATRLTVGLPEPLQSNCQQVMTLTYTLGIPPVLDGYFGRFGYLGFTERQINLGHWMPMIAIFSDEWTVPQTHFVGEQIISDVSDFDVTLQLVNAPTPIDIAAPGAVQRLAQDTWQYTFERGRDFSLSIGFGMKRTSELAPNGKVIEVFYFEETSPYNPAGEALESAIRSMLLYEELFGIPYPYDRLAIVEGDFPDGMEFSGLVFVGEAWFRIWRGAPNDWLTIITVHEVAHQWWYALVGNDPAEYPYMDEAFATYSEYLYYQRYYGDLTDWWWQFRIDAYELGEEGVDTNVYIYNDGRPYINAVYLRGARMLHNMRLQLGDEGFFTWLQSYMATNQYTIAEPIDLWSQLAPEQYDALAPIRQEFLLDWDILPPPETPMTPESTPEG